MVDQGISFGQLFANLAHIEGVELQRTGLEAHLSLNIGGRYHQPLRITFRKLMLDSPGADKHLTLTPTFKAMNDTLGPERLVPSTLVFGEHPPVCTRSETSSECPTIDERALIAFKARQ